MVTSYKQSMNILHVINSRNWSVLSSNRMTYPLAFVTGGLKYGQLETGNELSFLLIDNNW